MTDPTPTPTPHRATAAQWAQIERQTKAKPGWEIYGLSIAFANALLQHNDCLPVLLCRLDSLIKRVEALEAQQQAQAQPEPEPEQSLHTVALGMVDSLGRSFGLLPEILDTLRRAIREPMDPPAPCPHIVTSDEGTSYCSLAEQQAQPDAPAEDADERLIWQVARAMGWDYTDHWNPEARAVILVVARWLRANGLDYAADRLEQEAGR